LFYFFINFTEHLSYQRDSAGWWSLHRNLLSCVVSKNIAYCLFVANTPYRPAANYYGMQTPDTARTLIMHGVASVALWH